MDCEVNVTRVVRLEVSGEESTLKPDFFTHLRMVAGASATENLFLRGNPSQFLPVSLKPTSERGDCPSDQIPVPDPILSQDAGI